jgi:hypothetical protein
MCDTENTRPRAGVATVPWWLFPIEQVEKSSALRQWLRVLVYCEQRRGSKGAYGRRRSVGQTSWKEGIC